MHFERHISHPVTFEKLLERDVDPVEKKLRIYYRKIPARFRRAPGHVWRIWAPAALGQCLAQASTTCVQKDACHERCLQVPASLAIPALILKRSSRVWPGFLRVVDPLVARSLFDCRCPCSLQQGMHRATELDRQTCAGQQRFLSLQINESM